MHELDQLAVVEHRVAGLLRHLGKEVVAHGVGVAGLPGVLHRGQVVVGAAGGMGGRHVDAQLLAGGGHDAVDPLHGVGRVVDKHLDEVAVHLAAAIAADLVQQLAGVGGTVGVGLEGELGVDAAQVLAGLGHAGGALHADAAEAQLGSRCCGGGTGATRADHQDVAVVGGGDVGRVDNRLLAEPCGGGCGHAHAGVGGGALGGGHGGVGQGGLGPCGHGGRDGRSGGTQGGGLDKGAAVERFHRCASLLVDGLADRWRAASGLHHRAHKPKSALPPQGGKG